MTDTTRITVDVLDGPSVRYRDGAYFQGSKALLYSWDLSPAAMKLWLILDDHAQQNRIANPGRKRLKELMNVKSLRTLDTYIDELEDQGWLIVTPVVDSSGQHSNAYTLTIPKGLNVLTDDYKRSTKEIEVKPKPKMEKTRAALEVKETDIAPRYALSYNHTREDVPAPISRGGVQRALELSQSARRDTQALQSKTPQRPALPAAQTDKQKRQAEALARARELGTWESFREAFRSQAMAERAYKEYLREKGDQG
ncbi:helix-turn-helix domain-containing protein [Streptomyces sp. NBC_00588]|uniref:helix-turn-helix domain-containing protein n=1 Tax=Streptomyces sp. NBC_00588 TaxID=2975784 RepID=UPI002E820980|nr:helix-turn-helix domain-containing protein [Streptomyces sp. NBC_00588]WUB35372.1 helix-turn-helix domain-containing protein [Streptomyces sp. NBC_00588]